MGSSKQQLYDVEEYLEKKNLSWEDISGLLKVNNARAKDFEAVTLVGRLASRKIFPKTLIFPFIKAGWRFAPNMRIEDAGPNRFLFSFQSMEEKEKVLHLAPWNFKGYLMISKEWRRGEPINEVEIAHAEYWVQIHELPMESLDEENAFLLGSKLGSVMQVEMVDVNKPYLRVQVPFDIEIPLQLGFYLPRENQNPAWISFKFQRLSNLCLFCGRITHTMGTCIDDEHLYKFALGEEMRGSVPVEEMGPLIPTRQGVVIGDSRRTSSERVNNENTVQSLSSLAIPKVARGNTGYSVREFLVLRQGVHRRTIEDGWESRVDHEIHPLRLQLHLQISVRRQRTRL